MKELLCVVFDWDERTCFVYLTYVKESKKKTSVCLHIRHMGRARTGRSRVWTIMHPMAVRCLNVNRASKAPSVAIVNRTQAPRPDPSDRISTASISHSIRPGSAAAPGLI